jgi:hypothetical protein
MRHDFNGERMTAEIEEPVVDDFVELYRISSYAGERCSKSPILPS